MVLEECVVSSGLAGSVGAWVLAVMVVVIMFVVVEFMVLMVCAGHKQDWHPLARG